MNVALKLEFYLMSIFTFLGVNNLGVNCFEAKIGISNYPSISLFSKIGFEKIDENKIFKEYTFTRSITESWMKWLESETQFYVEDKKLK